LESRKSAEKAPVTVIQEAGIGGVSTGRVDELVQAMVRIPGESPANPR
jgi:putative transposase